MKKLLALLIIHCVTHIVAEPKIYKFTVFENFKDEYCCLMTLEIILHILNYSSFPYMYNVKEIAVSSLIHAE
jgi:hypothetical protein